MIEINPADWKTTPAAHQISGVKFLVSKKYAGLFDEQGLGKTKQAIDTVSTLYVNGEIDTVVVLAPSSVKSTWADPEFGEIKRHGWVPGLISIFWSYNTAFISPESVKSRGRLYWIVTGYEFIRVHARLNQILTGLKYRNYAVIADESSFIKSDKAEQTKAAMAIRKNAKYAYILSGTPMGNSPMDLYSQMSFLSPYILRVQNRFHFRARYIIMGGWQNKQIIGYQNLEELQALIKPHVIRRLKEDCLDLPPKTYSITEVPLSDRTWKLYCEMRDDMIVWLSENEVARAPQTVTKIMRLCQLTSGYLGGIDIDTPPENSLFEKNDQAFIQMLLDSADSDELIREVSDEKLRALEEAIDLSIEQNPEYRELIWFRFRVEQNRAADLFNRKRIPFVRIHGGQSKALRDETILRFTTKSPGKPLLLLGQPQAGGWGLNLQHQCHNVSYVSNDYNLITRLQSEDRVHRTGQSHAVHYRDYLACGPRGQKTIDHVIARARLAKHNLATWTTNEWREALTNEF